MTQGLLGSSDDSRESLLGSEDNWCGQLKQLSPLSDEMNCGTGGEADRGSVWGTFIVDEGITCNARNERWWLVTAFSDQVAA